MVNYSIRNCQKPVRPLKNGMIVWFNKSVCFESTGSSVCMHKDNRRVVKCKRVNIYMIIN